MAEALAFSRTADRHTIYTELVPQIEALISGEDDLTANLANTCAALRQAFGFFWVGFYVEKGGQLVLGPFQGDVACTRIDLDKGVCGHAFSTGSSVIVPDVDEFPGHIACSNASRSEVVVPVRDAAGRIVAVLDVDSDRLDDFSQTDVEGLEAVAAMIGRKWL